MFHKNKNSMDSAMTEQLQRLIENYLKEKIRKLTHNAGVAISASKNIMDMGVDSLSMVALTDEIQKELDIRLQPTVFFEYQNIVDLGGHLVEEFTDKVSSYFSANKIFGDSKDKSSKNPENDKNKIESGVVERQKEIDQLSLEDFFASTITDPHQAEPVMRYSGSVNSNNDGDIAVIGMAGIFAKSPNLDAFWHNLECGNNLFSDIPEDHFEYKHWCGTEAPDNIYCTKGSFIDDVDKFDAAFFNISPKEAKILDPQLRLLLQVIYTTTEDAGYGAKIRGSNTGMYVGACFHDYEIELIRHLGEVSPYFGTGNALTMLANRPSYCLDLKGPSMPIDTACSASLVAINTAISALRQKECDMAFVAGTNLLLSPVHYRYFCSIGALSKSGHSHPFDIRADGYVPGEAVGAVLLKPLKEALKDGDRIHALIKGAAINHGGYSSSFTAPSVTQEAQVLINAWKRSNIEPETIGYIEAHGTGTKLGDPIEVRALNAAFSQFTQKENFCALGTAKANIGHAEGAAGIAGLLKVILSMKHKTIPAMPHIEVVNPYIETQKSALYINRKSKPWSVDDGQPRRAGISSFGIGGAYAHVVVEEYIAEETPVTDVEDQECIVILSAKSEQRLREYAGNISRFVTKHSRRSNLADLSKGLVAASLEEDVTRFCVDKLHMPSSSITEIGSLEELGFDHVSYYQLAHFINEKYAIGLEPRDIATQETMAGVRQYLLAHFLDKIEAVYDLNESVLQVGFSLNRPLSLHDISYTLQVGREAMDYRLALVTASADSMCTALQQFENGITEIPGVYLGDTNQVRGNSRQLTVLFDCHEAKEFIKKLAAANRLHQLAQFWVTGVQIDWTSLPQNELARIISLPGYPFSKERYWFSDDVNIIQPLLETKIKPRSIQHSVSGEMDYQRKLADIWREYLSVDRLSAEDDFIALGGNSIVSAQIVTEIKNRFDVEFLATEFLGASTLGAIARLLQEKVENRNKKIPSLVPVIPKRTSQGDIPLSKDQTRLWVLAQMYPDNTRHNISSAYVVRAELDLEHLRRSLMHVVRRNEALRTLFLSSKGQPVQIIKNEMTIDVKEIKINNIEENSWNKEITFIIKQQAQQPFDLEKGPLFRVCLIRVAPQHVVLSLIVHHIIADIQSVDIMAGEIFEVYSEIQDGKETAHTAKSRQYADYILWRASQDPDKKENQLKYWKAKLKGANLVLNLPFDRPRSDKQSFNASRAKFTVDNELFSSVVQLAKRKKVTLFALILSVFNVVISRICQQQDILLGCPNSNRALPESTNMIGFLANTMVLRTVPSLSENFDHLLSQVKNTVYEAFDNQDITFADIVDALQVAYPKNHNPVFQILFNMIERKNDLGGHLDVTPFDLGLVTLDFDMLFGLEIRSGKLLGFLDYNPDLFDQSTATAVTESFISVMTQVVDGYKNDKNLLLSEIAVVSPLESKKSDQQAEKNAELVVISTFTADPIADTLAFWMKKLSLNYTVKFSAYNQLFQQLLDPTQLLLRNRDGVNLIMLRYDDWVRFDTDTDAEKINKRIIKTFEEFSKSLKAASTKAHSPIFVVVCPSNTGDSARVALHDELTGNLRKLIATLANTYFIGGEQAIETYEVDKVFDSVADKAGHIPYTAHYYTALGSTAIRHINSIFSKPHKVIVLDCDNTLWNGVCGEGGPAAVEIDSGRRVLQEFLVDQYEKGTLLCLCSKNEEKDVMDVFEKRSDMPLKLQHIVAWKINWEKKSKNIQELAVELNLGLDSFIFIDDNPIECAEVRAVCRDVLTLQLPQHEKGIVALSKHIWTLDKRSITSEDKKRTELYRQNVNRKRAQESLPSFAEFLDSLDLQIEMKTLDAETLPRVEQLMMRTNQFNTTTRRFSGDELTALINSEQYRCLTVNVKDRFGDYGLVGALLYQQQMQKLAVDSFILSCRVLGKGVEHYMLRQLGVIAKKNGLKDIVIHYIKSVRNTPAFDFLQSLSDASKDHGIDGKAIYNMSAESATKVEFQPSEEVLFDEQRSSVEVSTITPNVAFLTEVAQEYSDLRTIERDIEKWIAESHLSDATPDIDNYVAPGSEIEQALSRTYQIVLKKEKVSVTKSFFDIGGNSLLLVQLASAIKDNLDKEVSITDLFKYPSIRALAKFLHNTKGEKGISKHRRRAAAQRNILLSMQGA